MSKPFTSCECEFPEPATIASCSPPHGDTRVALTLPSSQYALTMLDSLPIPLSDLRWALRRHGGGQAAVSEEVTGVIQRLRPLLSGEAADTDVAMLTSMQLVARCLAGD